MTASTTTAETSGPGSQPSGHAAASAPLVESDHAATEMTYDEGRVPWFITLTWISFLALMVGYVIIYYVPDLRLWLQLPPP